MNSQEMTQRINEEFNQQIIELAAAGNEYQHWISDTHAYGDPSWQRVVDMSARTLDFMCGTKMFTAKPLSADYWHFNAELGRLQ